MNAQAQYHSLEAYCRCMNTLDIAPLATVLHPNFAYASQTVAEELTPCATFLDYMVGKLDTMRKSKQTSPVWAELCAPDEERPYALLAQGEKDNVVAVVFAKEQDGLLLRLDLCIVPPPQNFARTGVYPN